MLIRLNKNRAQSITEYAVLMGIIVLAIVLTQVYMKRSIQGKFKSTADDIGEQFTTGETYSAETIQQSLRQELSGTATLTDETGTAVAITTGKIWSHSRLPTTQDAGSYVEPVVTLLTSGGTKIGTIDRTTTATALTAYAGHEVTKRDYIDQAVAKDKGIIGSHKTFDSGVLQTKNPFEEANPD